MLSAEKLKNLQPLYIHKYLCFVCWTVAQLGEGRIKFRASQHISLPSCPPPLKFAYFCKQIKHWCANFCGELVAGLCKRPTSEAWGRRAKILCKRMMKNICWEQFSPTIPFQTVNFLKIKKGYLSKTVERPVFQIYIILIHFKYIFIYENPQLGPANCCKPIKRIYFIHSIKCTLYNIKTARCPNIYGNMRPLDLVLWPLV